MAAAWTIGKFFNIPIKIHYSMLLVVFLVWQMVPGGGLAGLIIGLVLFGLVFGSILLHEVGHALAARRYGIKTQDIILTPIGGIARLLSMPKNPRHEIVIAIAGPMVSFALAAGFFLLSQLMSLTILGGLGLFGRLFEINLILGLFNLIPALPMDGGRVLRGLLALKYDHLTATRKATRVARILAVGGAITMILGSALNLFEFHLTALIIAVFVYVTAGMELRMAELRAYQERAAREGAGPFWTSASPGVRTKTWTFNTSYPPNGANGSSSRPPNRDWSTAVPSSDDDNVVVITGGKAKIVSRTDPEDREED